ncbi:MAG: C1 family peptidase [Flavobacteriales bacterium]|jgi:bleomycin hydrolase|nr:C1 family peptidase [Flavobacteriales bacterium]
MKRIVFLSLLTSNFFFAQENDKAVFVKEPVSYYQHTIINALNGDHDKTEKTKLKVDQAEKDYPTNPLAYQTIWYNNLLSQGNTGTCWSFSTSSFMESEVQRLTGKEVNLSEMYTVYWEYVERTKYFVQHKGKMHLGEGSETNAIAKIMELYGTVPFEAYTGQKDGQAFYNHEPLFKAIETLFEQIKKEGEWNEEKAVIKVRELLDEHIGEVPEYVDVNGKNMSPIEYRDYLKIDPSNYVNFMSLMEAPYYQKALYNVPDNWWKSKDYNNIPLDDFVQLIKESISQGYSISIGGDVSEPGFDKISQTATIPSFDIKSDDIDENARQFRFTNGSTTDDHAMHLVGYYKAKDGKTWFLIKDSGSGSRNAGESSDKFGHYFMHEDYVKLKMMTITVHKDIAKKYLDKIK